MKRQLSKIDLASGPIFALTMLAEAMVLKRRATLRTPNDLDQADFATLSGTQLPPDPLVAVGYERRDTMASLTMLAGNVGFSLATLGLLSRLDQRLSRHALFQLGRRRKTTWVAAMLTWDLLYYWDHRVQHEVRLFWANHVTHHSSQRYNLSTALRQPWSGLLLSWVFAPMPLLGFPAKYTFRAGQLNLLYQYWIHTETIDRLPNAAEAVLNTPSHHRVHHGANKQYLDKNYGGILIVWDRLFGTFEPEVRQLKYGLTKNISTYNPIKIAYHEFGNIGRDVVGSKGLRTKMRHIFGRPGWQPNAPVGLDAPS